MNIVTDGILMISAVSLTVGAIHLRLCFQPGGRWKHILFVTSSFSVAIYALIERALMLASTPAEQMWLFYWGQLPATITLIAVAWFIHFYLDTGRAWLLWLFTLVRAASLAINFGSSTNLNFLEITSINRPTILGEQLSVTVGVPNPWMLVGQAALVLFIIFAFDAVIESWRRGDRRRAASFGAAVIIFSISSLCIAVLVLWGHIHLPLFTSPFFLLIVLVLGFELTRDVQRAGKLADNLKESDAALRERQGQLDLSAGAADVGIWSRDVNNQLITASEKWHELFEFGRDRAITFDQLVQKIHKDDRERVENDLRVVMDAGGKYETEYRLVLENGDIRWIGSRGSVEQVDGKPVRFRGASVDITRRKLAEEESMRADDLNTAVLASINSEIAILDRSGVIIAVNEAWNEFALGNGSAGAESRIGVGLNYIEVCQRASLAGEEMAQSVIKGLRSVLDGELAFFESEYPCDSPTESRWFRMRVMPLKRADGGVVVSHLDITERKLAEKDAHYLGRRLIHAQEEERARLARELHDDLGQSLALLSIQLEVLKQEHDAPQSVKTRIGDLTSDLHQLSSDIHRISHELHPAKLNQLGLESALRGFCREVADVHGIKIGFEANDVPRVLPNDISLCAYRITQESLQNVVKHSGASFASVVIAAADGEIRMVVSDDGHGFDPETAMTGKSLGLISMHERIMAVRGRIAVESAADAGTRIEASIPLPHD